MQITVKFDLRLFDNVDGLDTAKSGWAYAQAVSEAIAEKYPDAGISVSYADQTELLRSYYDCDDDGYEDEAATEHVYQIAQAVWTGDADWHVAE